MEELKAMFSDVTARFKSADSLLPSKDNYDKETVITGLKTSMDKLAETGKEVNLAEAIMDRAFGEITKYELLYLAVYHTQKHVYQLQNIYKAVRNKTKGTNIINEQSLINVLV